MYRKKRIAAVVAAAGKGSRMNGTINKQFLMLGDKPILAHTLRVLQGCSVVDEVIVVAAKDEIEYCYEHIINPYGFSKVRDVVAGGATRQRSMANGLNTVHPDTDIVVLHDGVRPFYSCELIEQGVRIIVEGRGDGAVCAVPLKDTVKVVGENGEAAATLDRSKLQAVQTPQCFRYSKILEAYRMAEREGREATDDSTLLEEFGGRVVLYPGSNRNIKITTPEDMIIAKAFLNWGDLT
ncbi:MAG: 2-C-methyl-D-erythritol 4-phosphate cytidylyltransferase [Firmicutes bacterium]|nr:2-C-methyl-D-erythritol 4-phosphate cytidylyltransferase [Bacillota bacterium]